MRRVQMIVAATTSLLLIATAASAAYTPDLDFGDQGKLTVSSSGPASFTSATNLGNHLVAGGYLDGGARITVAKYDSTGSPVTSFGNNGRRVISTGPSVSSVSVHQFPSGDLLVTGSTRRGFTLVRLNPNGSIQRSFGESGVVIRQGGRDSRDPHISTTIDSQRRIVVATGETTSANQYRKRIHVWRFMPSGVRDRSFGDGDVKASPARVNDVTGVATDGAGRVLLVTSQYSARNRDAHMSLVRIGAGGEKVQVLSRVAVWPHFGTYPTGIDRRGQGPFLVGVSGAPDGTPGSADGKTDRVGAIAFRTDGELARHYAEGGVLRARCKVDCYPVGQFVDDRGRVLLVGAVNSHPESQYVLDDSWASRFTRAGALDRSFSPAGWELRYSARMGADQGFAINVDGGGKLTLAGQLGGRDVDAYLARFNP